jgi:hypothetical protein
VYAERPDGAGKEHGQKGDHGKKDKDKDKDKGKSGKGGGQFSDDSRVAVREYYGGEVRSGRCPPGLAKKNNGCMPPGQAKKWRRGEPLPPDVVVYELPTELHVRIGIPPVGYKFVRVASDILMIAVGTSMVVDAIEDLGQL